MPLDGLVTKSLVTELNSLLKNGRIRKIYQPENDEIKITVNKGKENYNLLISSNSSNNRIHLTEINKPNPEVPPTFCMTLRKHIIGSEILSIEQYKSDRVIIINLSSYNEFGEPAVKQLICELTGHNSNIILIQKETNRIIDSLKKVGSLKSSYRHILPGEIYKTPPDEKENLFNFNIEEFKDNFKNSTKDIEKFFLNYFLGLSPLIIREICFENNIDPNTLIQKLEPNEQNIIIKTFLDYLESEKFYPNIFSINDNLDYYILPITLGNLKEDNYSNLSYLLEDFYKLRDKLAHFRSKSQNLKQQLNTLRKKTAKKIQNLHKDLKKTQNNDKNKLYGDLITANIWNLQKGLTEAELLDYTQDPPALVKVPLKINETPSQNAQRFYKKYSKYKRAQIELDKQLKKSQDELEYLDSLLASLETSTEVNELAEIQYEFNNSGFKKKSSNKSKKTLPSKPMHYISSEGFDIYVGKNNFQNDYISTELGTEEDCWLHVKDAPGSHVLIVANNKFITEATVLEGGMLAAYYSKQKMSENVPVNYTEFKNIKKPKKSKPGQVIFHEYNTMFITPDKEQIESLKRIE